MCLPLHRTLTRPHWQIVFCLVFGVKGTCFLLCTLDLIMFIMVYLILPYCRKYCSLVGQDSPLYVNNNILAVLVLLLVFGITKCCSHGVWSLLHQILPESTIFLSNISYFTINCVSDIILQLDISLFSHCKMAFS